MVIRLVNPKYITKESGKPQSQKTFQNIFTFQRIRDKNAYICSNVTKMKKLLLIVCGLIAGIGLMAQNDRADNIVGTYAGGSGKDAFKVKITKLQDGTYKGQVCWVAELYDANGVMDVDDKNPDKSLRNTPADKIVLFTGLKYNAKKQQWDGTKIYDPNRGIKVSMTATFDSPKVLKIRGSVLGIGETEVWKRVE